MMLRRKRAIAATLALAWIMVFASAPAALADTDGTWTWTQGPTSTTITGYSGPGGVVTIPATLGGTQVTDVGIDQVVFLQSDITRVVVPQGVIRIGQRAFSTSGLSSVSLPDTLMSIGDAAFANSRLQRVTIPASVSRLMENAFYLCQDMTAVLFLGDEPVTVQARVFGNTAPGFTVYYVNGKTGFASPPGPWVPTGIAYEGSYPTAYWPSFVITPSAGAGGAISPAVPTSVLEGLDSTFTITPAAGHHIVDVFTDGVSRGATTTCVFTEVRTDHTISVTFAADASLAPRVGAVYFAGDSARLTSAAKRALTRYAAMAAVQGIKDIALRGYTARREHGSRAYRLRLSALRARVVKAYLAGQFRRMHVPVRLAAVGYGGTGPAASNGTRSGRAKNRRVELVVR
jgi:outer membrane protein OmpA-like peptidoglycan-associated protein